MSIILLVSFCNIILQIVIPPSVVLLNVKAVFNNPVCQNQTWIRVRPEAFP
jgi:hypothetical protein